MGLRVKLDSVGDEQELKENYDQIDGDEGEMVL